MARLDNWQNNLHGLIEEHRHTPFDFATWNCAFWVSACNEAVVGFDPTAEYKGKFKTEKQAAVLLRKLDKVSTTQELFEKRFSEARPIAFAKMGDIVLVDPAAALLDLPADVDLFGAVPGICYGQLSYFVGEHGLIEVETLKLGQAIWVS